MVEPGDLIRHITAHHSAEGVVSIVASDGTFYKIGGEAHTYGWAQEGDVIQLIEKAKELPAMHTRDIVTQLNEMSDEELEEVIRGKRKLRREEPTKREKAEAKSTGNKAKKRMDEVMQQMKALPADAKADLLKLLGG